MKRKLGFLLAAMMLTALLTGCGKAEPADFAGTWAFNDCNSWICIYENGTYEIVDGDCVSRGIASYRIRGDSLYLEKEDVKIFRNKEGNLEVSSGSILLESELPQRLEGAFFEQMGITINGVTDGGFFRLEDSAWSYSESQNRYARFAADWQVTKNYITDLGNGYQELSFTITSKMPKDSYVSFWGEYVHGSSCIMYDYYTGLRFPTRSSEGNENAEDNWIDFRLEWNDDVYLISYTNDVVWQGEDETYYAGYSMTFTMIVPAGYDGLVVAAAPAAEHYTGFSTGVDRSVVTLANTHGDMLDQLLYFRIK